MFASSSVELHGAVLVSLELHFDRSLIFFYVLGDISGKSSLVKCFLNFGELAVSLASHNSLKEHEIFEGKTSFFINREVFVIGKLGVHSLDWIR
jgi:hypothetical protein